MKREQFLITSTQGHNITKTKWNASLREVERIVGELAKAEEDTYNLTLSESEKDGFYYVSGIRVWTRQSDKKEVSFFITKIA